MNLLYMEFVVMSIKIYKHIHTSYCPCTLRDVLDKHPYVCIINNIQMLLFSIKRQINAKCVIDMLFIIKLILTLFSKRKKFMKRSRHYKLMQILRLQHNLENSKRQVIMLSYTFVNLEQLLSLDFKNCTVSRS